MIDITVRVLEDILPGDLVADLELGRAWAPPPLLAWWREVLSKLQDQPRFRQPQLNPELTTLDLAGPAATIEVLFCSRTSLDELSGCPGALGVHLVSTPDCDPFNDEAAFARGYRVLVVSDRDEFIRLTRDIACEDGDPSRYLDSYVEAYAATVFHEIAHALLFAENAALLTPADIDLMSEVGEIGHDIFDCSTSYGIRPLEIEGAEVWADSMEEAKEMMECHVEDLARQMILTTLNGAYAPETLLDAMGVAPAEIIGADSAPSAASG